MLFNEVEIKNLNQFEKEHKICYSTNNPAKNDAGYIIRTGATGIGFQTFIKCNCCGIEKDITDYGCW